MIIVMHEGDDSWYTDSATVLSDKYETYILNELIPHVQNRYRTIETRFGRGVAGLSMGGYGALKFGLKSSGTFIFAGSLSGALSIPSWTVKDLEGAPANLRESVLNALGSPDSPTRKANDIFELVRSLPADRVGGLPYLYLDCGTEDEL